MISPQASLLDLTNGGFKGDLGRALRPLYMQKISKPLKSALKFIKVHLKNIFLRLRVLSFGRESYFQGFRDKSWILQNGKPLCIFFIIPVPFWYVDFNKLYCSIVAILHPFMRSKLKLSCLFYTNPDNHQMAAQTDRKSYLRSSGRQLDSSNPDLVALKIYSMNSIQFFFKQKDSIQLEQGREVLITINWTSGQKCTSRAKHYLDEDAF